MKKSTLCSWLSLACVLMSAGSAQAGYTTYFGEDLNNSSSRPVASLANSSTAQSNFLGQMTQTGVESFEGATVGAGTGLAIGFQGYQGNGLTATLTGGGSVLNNLNNNSSNLGRYSVVGSTPASRGNKYWSADLLQNSFSVTFNTGIAAFGFYGTDIGDFGGQAIVDIFNGTTLLDSITVPSTPGPGTDGSALYFGFVAQSTSDVFTSIRFRTSAATGSITEDVFGFDGFTIAEARQLNTSLTPPGSNPAPEPATLALVGLGLLGAGLVQRRRT